VLFAVWLAYASFGLTAVALAPLVLPITRDLALSHSEMGAILGIWQAVYIFAAVPCGALLDRLGARRAIFVGALFIALSGAMRGLAFDFWSFCLAVGVFGAGGPLVSAGAPKVVSHWFKGSERGLAMGIYITGPAVGAIAGLSLTNSVLMPPFDGDWRRVLAASSAVAFAGALAWIAIASLPAVRANEPAVPPAAERPPQREILLLLVRLPELLRAVGMTPAEAGFWATIPTLVGIAGSLLIPRLATPPRRFAILGALALCAGASAVLLQSEPGPLLAAGLVAQGIARSSLMTVAMLALVETRGVGERHAGTAGGLFFSAAEVGGAGGPIALGVLFDATGGFAAGLWMLAALAALMLLGALRLRALEARAAA